MVRVAPIKGSPFALQLDQPLHLMRVDARLRHGREIRDVSVREWSAWPPSHQRRFKLSRSAVEFEPGPELLPLDPYFLGVLLGDGCLRGGVSVCKPEPEIHDEVIAQARAFGLSTSVDCHDGVATTIRLSAGRGGASSRNEVIERLKTLGLYRTRSATKFVPAVYKTASAAGLAAYVTPCQKRAQTGPFGTYYRVSISGDPTIVPCRVPRRQGAPRRQRKSVLRTGITVEPLGEGSFIALRLDGDGLFLAEDFTVLRDAGVAHRTLQALN
jgi:hypothetical protein